MEILNPPGWPRPKGYSNGISIGAGRMVYCAGMVGWNEREEFDAKDTVGQARQIFKNIVAVLTEAKAKPEHIVRMTWYITDKDEYLNGGREIGAAYREIIGRHFPVMAVVVVKGLIETGAKLEIEATAIVPND